VESPTGVMKRGWLRGLQWKNAGVPMKPFQMSFWLKYLQKNKEKHAFALIACISLKKHNSVQLELSVFCFLLFAFCNFLTGHN